MMLLWVPVVALLVTAYHGCVLLMLWSWFIMPLGAPSITLAQACGLTLIMTLVQSYTPTTKDRDPFEPLVHLLVGPLACLAFGWVLHFWV